MSKEFFRNVNFPEAPHFANEYPFIMRISTKGRQKAHKKGQAKKLGSTLKSYFPSMAILYDRCQPQLLVLLF
jgi:hypothetical protein